MPKKTESEAQELFQTPLSSPRGGDAFFDLPEDLDTKGIPLSCSGDVLVFRRDLTLKDVSKVSQDEPEWKRLSEEAKQQLAAGGDFKVAAQALQNAISMLEELVGEEPKAREDRAALSALCTSRAQALLGIAKKCREAKALPEMRKACMRANLEASRASDLDSSNAMAWARRGQAQLGLSTTQARAKDAVSSFETARASTKLSSSDRSMVEQWLKEAKRVVDSQTDMPPGCPQM